MSDLSTLQEQYAVVKARDLNLNMTRGQPSDQDFDLSNKLLSILSDTDYMTPSGFDVRNYPGGVAGLPEARTLFAAMIGVESSEIIVQNNASLEIMAHVLQWALLKGVRNSASPWIAQKPKMIVTVPGYDRHFKLLHTLGFELLSVQMTPDGPDLDQVEALAAADARIKGIFFVPTYSNPTGDTISDENIQRLASLPAAASDFTIFADDAYRVHHFTDDPDDPTNMLRACQAAGNPDRIFIFGSTSKITFAGGGLGFVAASEANISYLTSLLGVQTIGPNKVEQYRHVKFLEAYPGGIAGLMQAHAKIIAPKFNAVQEVLDQELGGSGLATWTTPKGGYFISLDTDRPVADRVVQLSKEAGVALTPAGATFPNREDPHKSNIRLAPTRPPVDEVVEAMHVVALCVKLASAEYDARE